MLLINFIMVSSYSSHSSKVKKLNITDNNKQYNDNGNDNIDKKRFVSIARLSSNKKRNYRTSQENILNYSLLFIVILITILTYPQDFLNSSDNKVRIYISIIFQLFFYAHY